MATRDAMDQMSHEYGDIHYWKPGDKCQVYSFGCWYDGEVIKVGRSRVTVAYRSNDSDVHARLKAFPPKLVAPHTTYVTRTRKWYY